MKHSFSFSSARYSTLSKQNIRMLHKLVQSGCNRKGWRESSHQVLSPFHVSLTGESIDREPVLGKLKLLCSIIHPIGSAGGDRLTH